MEAAVFELNIPRGLLIRRIDQQAGVFEGWKTSLNEVFQADIALLLRADVERFEMVFPLWRLFNLSTRLNQGRREMISMGRTSEERIVFNRHRTKEQQATERSPELALGEEVKLGSTEFEHL